MVLGFLRGPVRGGVAWATGYVLTLVLVVVGVLDGPGGPFRATASAYVDAHFLPVVVVGSLLYGLALGIPAAVGGALS